MAATAIQTQEMVQHVVITLQ